MSTLPPTRSRPIASRSSPVVRRYGAAFRAELISTSRNRSLDAPSTVTQLAALVLGRRRRRRLNRLDLRLLDQSQRQHLVDPLHRLDLKIALDVVGYLDEILLVCHRSA